ncbi:anion exchange protein 2-like isoform X2 [Anopheles albimanus]|uniref:anion exchange protein 2-like isoform X2 n=1 Tax=Anopheles albimanus TaxID=7167 RepID=UPI001642248C|nr:anion exchange protein 2-like isoform X2 [Anopheles albimanus]XP_035792681.1 anion exchange protein 2-like isoform X2 [Anopheles albimanus]XP_035792682.1 anion exchange protein 2-like isoform X2 [Anopheles albimanus]XP_035792683.1 anion exchange protein 2-like isoform X2 [Anopheles albimanus]XP_035792684.1 anion exchange protein 2-like isoform X2 [Anopheles albimanus]
MSRRDNNVRKLSFLGFNTKETSNDDPNEVHLDDEIERVFGTSSVEKERFELNRLQDAVILDNSPLKYDEAHRVPGAGGGGAADPDAGGTSDRAPATGTTASSSSTGSSAASNNNVTEAKGRTANGATGRSGTTSPPTSPISFSSKSEATDTKPSTAGNSTTLADNTSNDFSETVHDEPIVDQGTTQGEQWDTSARRNVHFDKDKAAHFHGLPLEDTNEERRRRTERQVQQGKPVRSRRRHHPHKSRKFSLQEYHPEWRRQSGAEGGPTGRRVSVQPEDATLQEADIDELTSHRSDDPRALRRHKVSQAQASSSVVNINRKEAGVPLAQLLPSTKYKKLYDHSPHEVFVQLDELTGSGEEREWKETARWIKYEEDVEEGADRWGRPHVASLSFHSLLNLRRCLETGVVLMDLEEKDLPSVAYRIVEQMVVDELIHEDDKPVIMRALLLRHRHVNESSHGGFSFGPKRKYSSYTSLQSLSLRAEEVNAGGNGGNVGGSEVIVGVRRLNSFVSPTPSHTLSPPSSLHPSSVYGQSPNLSSRHQPAQRSHHQQHQQQQQHHHHHHHQRHSASDRSKRSSSQEESGGGPVPPVTALTTVASAVGMRRSHSPQSLTVSVDDKKPRIVPSSEINGHGGGSHGGHETRINVEETYTSSQEDIKMRTTQQKESILKRIPEGAEATTVLVGAVDFLEQPTIAFVRLAEGIPMPSITEVPIPVRFLFILLGPQRAQLDYHEVGRSIATLMSNEHFHDIAYKADDRRELLSAINEFLDDSIVLPPGKWERQALLPFEELKAKSDMIRMRKKKALDERNRSKQQPGALLTSEEEKKLLEAAASGAGGAGDPGDGKKPKKNPLEKTNRLWGGLINDIKRRYPMYKSDILDGLNSETFAATIFMYFAALSTAITFGGLSSDKTHNLIGISETLVAASMVGIVFHALAGQPLVIVGTTGPLLLFDEALNQFCISNNFSFLTVRVYVGCWLAIIALAVSAFEGSVYVRLFTRFTQEIFSALISLIFIVETIMKLVYVYGRHPLLAEYNYQNVTIPTPHPAPYAASEANDTTTDTVADLLAESLTSAVNVTVASVTALEDASASLSGLIPPFDAIGPKNQPNTALFCTILTLGTFGLAYYLKLFRNSRILGRNARRALGDFGVPISIALFVLFDYSIPQVYTEKLSVPEGLSPSDTSQRGWLIPLGGVPGWVPFAAGVPALLVYILIFMETHISELIVDKPERGLKKGSGLHLDIVLLCFLNTLCGLFGMPWHCAATVRSVTHVSAVTIMSRTHAPGEAPHITDVKEQRLSGLFVSLLVGLSVTMAPILRLIPISVLFGVFLYMGIASMSGVQLFERLRLYLVPLKHYPQVPFVRRVPTWKMHLFTLVQVLALAMLWAVKSSPFSLALPFFLIMMVPTRHMLEKIFSPLELRALDGSQPNEGAEDEPDFYEQAPIPA